MSSRTKVSPADISITHVRGSGPGGQNRNKRMSGVRVVHHPTGLVVTATERRSQAQNLSAALARLEEKLEKRAHRDKPRFATRTPRSAKEQRIKQKQRTSRTKILRGRPSEND